MGGGRYGVEVHHGDEVENQERWQEPNKSLPTWRTKYRSDFTTFPPALLQEQSIVVLCLKGFWSLGC
jgi:hypothetical protein